MNITRERVEYYSEAVPETLAGFMAWQFTTGSTTGEDFKRFARLFRAEIKRSLPGCAELVNVNAGHYYLSGFVKRGDKFVYWSISDVRFFPGAWHKSMLVRTARHDRDYTGGINCATSLEDFRESVERLLNCQGGE